MRPIDVEAAVVAFAASKSLDMAAYPVPRNLGVRTPFTVIQRTGGATASKVLDAHDVSFDCYAQRWDEAMDAASDVCGLVHALEGLDVGGAYCFRSQLRTLPYNNPDPNRPDLARVTLSAVLTFREH